MSYLLTGFLAQHFRATENRWQTMKELKVQTGKNYNRLVSDLGSLRDRGHLETRGEHHYMQYRLRPQSLQATRDQTGPSVAQVTEAFCRRWKVNAPFEATEVHPRALSEWLEVTGNRV